MKFSWHLTLPSGTGSHKLVACSEVIHWDLLKIPPWNLFFLFSCLLFLCGNFFYYLNFHLFKYSLQKMWALSQKEWMSGEEISKLDACTAWEEYWWEAAHAWGDRGHHGNGCGSQGPPDPPDYMGKCWREAAGCLQARANGAGLSVHPGCLILSLLWAVGLRDVDLQSHVCCTLRKDTMNSQIKTNRRCVFHI